MAQIPNVSLSGGPTPLVTAICANDFDIVKLLLTYNVDVNKQEFGTVAPIGQAILKRNLLLVRLLCNNSADLNVCVLMHGTPLCISINQQNINIVKTLLAHGADPNLGWKHRLVTPLEKAYHLENRCNCV